MAVVSCSGSDADDGYSAELRKDFVGDCTDSGTARKVCGCVYDALEADVPFDRFEELDEQLREGAIAVPDDIQQIVVTCAVDAEDS
jgi:hypothetical protein